MSSSPTQTPVSLSEAYAHCTALTKAHYENFPVGWLMPKAKIRHVHAIYAFARHTDDLADEGYASGHDFGGEIPPQPTPAERLAALEKWEVGLADPAAAEMANEPILIALHATIKELDLPKSLFTDLLSAFQQDVVKTRYANQAEILDYCRRSANPIGRLVLLLNGHRDEEKFRQSDAICTGLQVANFWQDISVDLLKDRIYLPQDEMAALGVTVDDLKAGRSTPAFRTLVENQVAKAWALFDEGKGLSKTLPIPLKWEIAVTWLGGTTILKKIEALDYDTLRTRPKLSKFDIPLLFLRTLLTF
ncbi:squalene synthase HpnC [Verrucomicrobium sp. GAS474]|uniref:squalene synthase HpnC n=1 Tax=Verrucomicrobium sp. GAS474 TaxID=1882831 RepID=UPI000B80B26E|nr:squalene synthase HpnC [Verrucomicrobium sp. GAS474]